MVIKHLWGKNPEVDPNVNVDVVHCHGIIKGDSKKLLFRDYTKFLEFILVVFHFVSVLLLIADFIWKLSIIRSCWKPFFVHGELWGTFKFVLNFELLIATWYFAYPYVFGVLRFIPSKFGIYIIFGNKSECEVVLETLRDNFLLNYILETSQPVESLFRLEVDQSHSVISSIDHIDVCGALSILYVNKTWSNFSIWKHFTRCLSLSSQFYRYTEIAECFNLTKSVLDNNDEKSTELHHNNPETSDNQSNNLGEKLTHWETFLCGTDRMAAYDPENQVVHIICHSIFNPTFPAMFIFPRIVPILLFISVVLNSFI